MIIIKPQPKQEEFISCSADIVLYGGSAGAGKSFAILFDSIRYLNTNGYSAIYFRRQGVDLMKPGGLWSESYKFYSYFKSKTNKQQKEWSFYNKQTGNLTSTVTFAHIENDEAVYNWQGAQICGMYFDELTHFTWHQFQYLMSRNRSVCGIKPYIRATCNPEKDHWLRNFIDWYIDENTGYAIQERSGIIRYFIINNDEIIWGDSENELLLKMDPELVSKGGRPRSFTFISAKLTDNQILMQNDVNYLSNLMALNHVERAKLLDGNWNISYNDFGEVINKKDFTRYDLSQLLKIPGYFTESYFVIDSASTINTYSDYSVIMFFAKDKKQNIYIIDVVRDKMEEPDLEQKIIDTWEQWRNVKVGANYVFSPKGINIENKSSGISMLQRLKRKNIPVFELSPIKDKFLRLNDGLGLIKNGIVHVPSQAGWVAKFLEECENFRADLKHVLGQGEKLPHDDQVDCLAYGIGREINNKSAIRVFNPIKTQTRSRIWE